MMAEEQRDISAEPIVLMAVVTVRIKPAKKKYTEYTMQTKETGICPLSEKLGYQILCDDIYGEHHSYTLMGYDANDIERKAKEMFDHITRIELLPSVVD